MPIRLNELRAARGRFVRAAENLEEATRRARRTAFLCHSHRDQDLVEGFLVLLKEAGCDAYVDWMDDDLPPKPDRLTASQIKSKIRELDLFFFLATPASTTSRWCPWEIGYADAVKGANNILIIATEENGATYGSEYLDLYPRVDRAFSVPLGVFGPASAGFLKPAARL